ncbi:MAG TPA: glycosyltransferase [Sphingomicrobium sp.]|nr:glycosyltransferase [Sphingomicrobium sp.]
MRQVRILHLTSTPAGIGGVERLLLDLAPHYDRARVHVAHCNLFDQAQGSGRFPTALKATGLPYVEIEGSRWHHLPGIIGQLLAAIRRERIDVLHLHMVHATIVGGLVALLSPGLSVVVTKHYVYRALASRMLRLLDRLSTNRADAIVAVSGHVRDDLVAHGAQRAKSEVIHNGMDLEAFDRQAAAPSQPLARQEGGALIGCVGNLNPIKGHEYLVRAMPRVLQRFPTARLVMIGEGGAKAELEALARALGVEGAVIMAGFRGDVPAVMRQIDICVQPSLQEAFGIVLLEAMAAARPVVATGVEGIPEIVVDGTTGLLVPPRDPEALAKAICALLQDGEARRAMGSAGRSRVEQRFDIRTTVRAYEELYGMLGERIARSEAKPLPDAAER